MKTSRISIFPFVSILVGVWAAPVLGQGSLTVGPEPRPSDGIGAQLSRYRGQTRFLNYYGHGNFKGPKPMPGMPEAGAGRKGADRAVQESDVFKVGSPGSKLLYLLNQYRGLQVVSFAKGDASPELLGRAEATGNYPEDMYLDEAHGRILVLERQWRQRTEGSRIVAYDVRDPAEPRLAGELLLEGDLADSRMVGNVLYVATTRAHFGDDGQNHSKGYVHSVALKAGGLALVERKELALPVSYRENMNIIETSEKGVIRYYLVAILSQSGWGWWDRQSMVEVVDITDPNGAIVPLMAVSARGRVNERSQTQIQGGTLIVASNYGGENGAPTRIAVEGFELPRKGAKIITEREAEFRKLRIERELEGKSSAERERAYNRLIADAELGIQGVFVKSDGKSLRKMVPDSVSTVGDSNGLHAILQDARFVGNLLYVFWVPQNQVDPLDVFDISQPAKAIKHLKRLYFDGWMERAIPLRHEGRDFVLGLGWVVPAVDNERGERYPQAMLIEIARGAAGLETIVRSQLTLTKSGWSNFNQGDKFVELRDNGDGTGSVLFQASYWDGHAYHDGAKVVGFDLVRAAGGSGAGLSEGAFIAGDSGWLRRVFTNSEIGKLNTFSNEALGTFESPSVTAAGQVVRAISVLELARSIEAYTTLGAGGSLRGVQVIRQGAKTVLRLVDPRMADSEKNQVLSELVLEGQYQDRLEDPRSSGLWLVTSRSERDGSGAYKSFKSVVFVRLDAAGKRLETLRQVEWEETRQGGPWGNGGARSFMPPYWNWVSSRLTRLDDGAVLLISGQELKRLELERPSGFSVLSFKNCELTREQGSEIQVVSGRLFVASKEFVEDPDRLEVVYARHFIAPVTIAGDTAHCGTKVNIPGSLKSILPGGHFITEDNKLLDLVRRSYDNGGSGDAREYVYYEAQMQPSLVSLRSEEGMARLTDDLDLPEATPSLRNLGGTSLGYLEKASLVSIGVDEESRFHKQVFSLGLPEGYSLAQVFGADEPKGLRLGLFSDGSKIRLFRWSDTELRPMAVSFTPVDFRFRAKARTDTLVLTGWFSTWGEPRQAHFTPSLGSVEIADGLYGVYQLLL